MNFEPILYDLVKTCSMCLCHTVALNFCTTIDPYFNQTAYTTEEIVNYRIFTIKH